jgi:hypothetical protein
MSYIKAPAIESNKQQSTCSKERNFECFKRIINRSFVISKRLFMENDEDIGRPELRKQESKLLDYSRHRSDDKSVDTSSLESFSCHHKCGSASYDSFIHRKTANVEKAISAVKFLMDLPMEGPMEEPLELLPKAYRSDNDDSDSDSEDDDDGDEGSFSNDDSLSYFTPFKIPGRRGSSRRTDQLPFASPLSSNVSKDRHAKLGSISDSEHSVSFRLRRTDSAKIPVQDEERISSSDRFEMCLRDLSFNDDDLCNSVHLHAPISPPSVVSAPVDAENASNPSLFLFGTSSSKSLFRRSKSFRSESRVPMEIEAEANMAVDKAHADSITESSSHSSSVSTRRRNRRRHTVSTKVESSSSHPGASNNSSRRERRSTDPSLASVLSTRSYSSASHGSGSSGGSRKNKTTGSGAQRKRSSSLFLGQAQDSFSSISSFSSTSNLLAVDNCKTRVIPRRSKSAQHQVDPLAIASSGSRPSSCRGALPRRSKSLNVKHPPFNRGFSSSSSVASRSSCESAGSRKNGASSVSSRSSHRSGGRRKKLAAVASGTPNSKPRRKSTSMLYLSQTQHSFSSISSFEASTSNLLEEDKHKTMATPCHSKSEDQQADPLALSSRSNHSRSSIDSRSRGRKLPARRKSMYAKLEDSSSNSLFFEDGSDASLFLTGSRIRRL